MTMRIPVSAARAALAVLMLSSLAAPGPAAAASVGRYPGENGISRGRYHEARGEIDAARRAYLDVLHRAASQRAVADALDHLADIAGRTGNPALQMRYLEAAASAGRPERLVAAARLAEDAGTVPPSFRTLAPVYERVALDVSSGSIALFMAARAEAGDLAGTGVVNLDPRFWYAVAYRRGSNGAVPKLLALAASDGRDGDVARLVAGLEPERARKEIVDLARALAVGGGDMPGDRDRAGRMLALLPAPTAAEASAKLMREATAAGDIDGALFWLSRAGDLGERESAALVGIHRQAPGEAARAAVLDRLKAMASGGSPAAAAALARIMTANGEPPDADAIGWMLAAYRSGSDADGIDALYPLLVGLPRDGVETPAILAKTTGAAEAGNVVAMTLLARLLATGGPVDVDGAASADWYRRAAEAGGAEAQYQVGMGLAGVGDDPAAARAWLERAAGQKFQPAALALAALVQQPSDAAPDP